MRKPELALLAAALVAGAVVRFAGIDGLPPFIDESGHIYYVNDLHPSFYKVGKVLGQYIMRPAVNLSADPLSGARKLVAFLGLLSIAGVYFAVRELARAGGLARDWIAAGVAAAAWALQPIVVFHDRLALHDPMVSLFHSWALYIAVRGIRSASMALAAMAGLLCGIAALVKLPMILLGGTCVVVALAATPAADRKSRIPAMAVLLGASLLPLLFLLPHFGELMDMAGSHMGGGGVGRNLAMLYDSLASYNSPLFLLLLLVCTVLAIRSKDPVRIVLAALSALALLGFSIVLGVFVSRYVLACLIPAAALIGLTLARVDWTAADSRPGNIVLGGIAAVMALQWLGFDYTIASNPTAAALPSADDRQYLTGWPSGAGTRELTGFLRTEAGRGADPSLVSVGGFGRHGAWVVAPRLAAEPKFQFRQGFIDSPEAAAALLAEGRDGRTLIVDEPPAYEIPPAVFDLIVPKPRLLFNHERHIPREGITDGALRVWEIQPGSRIRLPAPAGPPVPESEPPSIESISNPNGREGARQEFMWVGGGATTVVIRSGKKGWMRLVATISPGPSLPGTVRNVLIDSGGDFEEVLDLSPGPAVFEVPVNAGRTRIQILSLDRRAVAQLPNGDRRPLMVGLHDLRIDGFSDKPTAQRPPKCWMQFAEGVHGVESLGTGWFRWTTGNAGLRLFSSRPVEAEITGNFFAIVRPARIAAVLQDKELAGWDIAPGQEKPAPLPPLRVSLPAGATVLTLRSDKPGVKPQGDARVLNFALADIKVRTNNGANCEVR